MASEISGSEKEVGALVSGIFERKKEFHRSQARLPIEEKIRILVELQKIAISARPGRQPNDRRVVWKLT